MVVTWYMMIRVYHLSIVYGCIVSVHGVASYKFLICGVGCSHVCDVSLVLVSTLVLVAMCIYPRH